MCFKDLPGRGYSSSLLPRHENVRHETLANRAQMEYLWLSVPYEAPHRLYVRLGIMIIVLLYKWTLEFFWLNVKY